MSDLVDGMKQQLAQRLEELRPAVEEFRKLEAAQRALEGLAERPKGRRKAA